MNLTIHRGSKEIGGSCVEVESQGKRLLIDLGLPLDAEGDPRQFLPKVAGLDGKGQSLLGILISHPHQDHFGLLAEVALTIKTGMGAAARRILLAAGPFMPNKYEPPPTGWDFESENPLQIGPFTVTPFLVDHSAYDSYALLIEADGKKVFYSGDFRAHGRKGSLFDKMIQRPPHDIDVLLLEGTCIGRIKDGESFPTEQELEAKFIEAFSATKGLSLVQCSAQNIDRIVSICRACKQTGRTLVIDLYASAVLEATGNLKLPQSSWDGVALFMPQSQRIKVKNNKWFDLLSRHSKNRIFIMGHPQKKQWPKDLIQKNPEKYVLLFRPLHIGDLEQGDCLAGASYIYSQWEGYRKRKDFDEVNVFLKRHGIKEQHIHTSGHASPADLQKFAKALKPGKLVPIHTFEPERYKELFENVEIHKDGEPWKVE
jgi:ribonuclease J